MEKVLAKHFWLISSKSPVGWTDLIETQCPLLFFMDALVESVLVLIKSTTRPLSFSEIAESIHVTEVDSDLLLERIKSCPAIFHQTYTFDGKPLTLFWRGDIRQKISEDALHNWLKKSSIVSTFLSQYLYLRTCSPSLNSLIYQLFRKNGITSFSLFLSPFTFIHIFFLNYLTVPCLSLL